MGSRPWAGAPFEPTFEHCSNLRSNRSSIHRTTRGDEARVRWPALRFEPTFEHCSNAFVREHLFWFLGFPATPVTRGTKNIGRGSVYIVFIRRSVWSGTARGSRSSHVNASRPHTIRAGHQRWSRETEGARFGLVVVLLALHFGNAHRPRKLKTRIVIAPKITNDRVHEVLVEDGTKAAWKCVGHGDPAQIQIVVAAKQGDTDFTISMPGANAKYAACVRANVVERLRRLFVHRIDSDIESTLTFKLVH